MATPLAQAVAQLAAQALAAHGLTLVQARLSGGTSSGRGKQTLNVLVERPDGTSPTLEECTAVSRTLSAQLDVADLISGAYTLEVGSPGADRPLITPADYQRFSGKQARLVFHAPVPNPSGKGVLGSAIGVIQQPTSSGLVLALKDGGSLTLTHAQIHHAALEPSAAELKELLATASRKPRFNASTEE